MESISSIRALRGFIVVLSPSLKAIPSTPLRSLPCSRCSSKSITVSSPSPKMTASAWSLFKKYFGSGLGPKPPIM